MENFFLIHVTILICLYIHVLLLVCGESSMYEHVPEYALTHSHLVA